MKLTMRIACVLGILGMASVVWGAPSGGQAPGITRQRPVVIQRAMTPMTACPTLSAEDEAFWGNIIASVAAQALGPESADPFSCYVQGETEKKEHALLHWHLLKGIEAQSSAEVYAVLSTFAKANCDESYEVAVAPFSTCPSVDSLSGIVECSMNALRAIKANHDLIKGMMEKLAECAQCK